MGRCTADEDGKLPTCKVLVEITTHHGESRYTSETTGTIRTRCFRRLNGSTHKLLKDTKRGVRRVINRMGMTGYGATCVST